MFVLGDPWLHLVIVVEVLGVHFVRHFRHEGGGRGPDVLPVDAMEERVGLDLGQGQSHVLVTNKGLYEVLGHKRDAHILRNLEVLLVIDNLAHREVSTLGVERGVSREHLIENDANTPVVH